MNYDTLSMAFMIVIIGGPILIVIIRFIYEYIKGKRKPDYKSDYVSDLLKIEDPITGLPKSVVDNTQADDYLKAAKNMEQRNPVSRDIDEI